MRNGNRKWLRLLLPGMIAVAAGAGPWTAAAQTGGTTPAKKDDASHPVSAGTAAGPAAGTFAIPGTESTIKLGGYLKVDWIQDFDAIGDAYEFKVNSIPVEGSAAADQDERTTIHARESRLNLDYRSGKGFRAFVEGDFFGDKNVFRLRHAYGELGPLLGGQTWTTFMDITARPLTVDVEGAEGEVFLRQAMIRLSRPFSDTWRGSIAIENPSPEFAVPGALEGSARSSMPDVGAMGRGTGKPGHVQVAAVLRQLRFDGEGPSADQSEIGWGLNASAGVKTVGSDELLLQFVVGEGIAHYIEGLSGQNSDAAFDVNDELQPLPVMGMVAGYTRHWSPTLRSGFAFSMAELDNDPAQGGGALAGIRDLRVNLIHSYATNVDLCGEALWGRREDQDGSSGEAWRGQFAILYHLK